MLVPVLFRVLGNDTYKIKVYNLTKKVGERWLILVGSTKRRV